MKASAHRTWRRIGLAALGLAVLPLLVASKEHSTAASPAHRVVQPAATSDHAVAPLTAVPEVPAAVQRASTRADFGSERPSRDTYQIANWIVHSADNGALPFVIVDKRKARVYAFSVDGHLRGTAPVLLGLTRGDYSVPGIGERKIADILPHERTTPAGRFVAELGVNAKGEDIIWVDYDSAVSMHRVRAINPKERRLERLSSPTPDDNRISYGCINVPVQFYETVLMPTMAAHRAIVYVLPEVRLAREVFGAYDVDERERVAANGQVHSVVAQAPGRSSKRAQASTTR